MPLIAASFLWCAVTLGVCAWLWTLGEAKGRAVAAQIAAGVPVIAWAWLTASGRRVLWDRRSTCGLLLAAAALRLIFIPLVPVQSDDLYRYLWEGRMQLAGLNPYAHAPDSEVAVRLRDADWEHINHREYSAIYPPLAQASFMMTAAISPTPTAFKMFFALCDLGVLMVLIAWLRDRRIGPAAAAVWAFHPLVICEFAGNGHLDSFMILAVVLSLLMLDRGRENLAVFALAAAVAVKLIPLLLAPFFLRGMKRPGLILLVPMLAGLSYLPYAGAGADGLFSSLWVYQRDWLYNSPLFDLARDFLFGEDGYLARKWFYAGVAAAVATLWFARVAPRAAALPLFGFLHAAGPVIHPWYLTLELALAVPGVRRDGEVAGRGTWPWLWLTLLAPLAYVGEDAAPGEMWLVRALVWGPFFSGLAVSAATGLIVEFRRGKGSAE